MPTFRPDISPDILRWAREWAGHSLEEVVEKVPAYESWERGEKRPTMKQLEGISRRFRTPLGYFFLKEPPKIEVPIPDFRTVGNAKPDLPSPDLVEVMNQMLGRQEWMRQYLRDEGEDPLEFVGRSTINDPVENVADNIRSTLGLKENWPEDLGTLDDAWRHLRGAIEGARIMVVIAGYAGRNTRRLLSVTEFRGFVLSDDYAPLIFVNGRDAKHAQMFTLAHELAHLWIGQNALFDLPKLLSPKDVASETYCNRVAAEFLVPAAQFESIWETAKNHATPFKVISRKFRVSQTVAARKALDLGHISKTEFFDFYNKRSQAYLEAASARKKQSGGSYWNNQGTRIGRLFGSAVVRAVSEGRLLYTDAYQMTGLRSSTLKEFANRLGLTG